MALLQRNITGYDLLATRSYIDNKGPVTEEQLLADYYPGDPDNPENSDQLKPIRDCVRFLVEIDQVEEEENEYVLSSDIPGGLRPRLAILWGIARQEGENSAYFDVLDHLASENITRFDHGDELVDMMDGAHPELPWNPDRLRYWRRVMNMLGVTREINPEKEDATTLLALDADLLLGITGYCMNANTGSLVEVLEAIDETFLPVYSNQGTIASYLETSLQYVERQDLISLSRRSDRDVSIEVAGTPYNSIKLTQ